MDICMHAHLESRYEDGHGESEGESESGGEVKL